MTVTRDIYADLNLHGGKIANVADPGSAQDAATKNYVDTKVPITTRGDLLTRGASADARLAIGAADTVLKSDGTDPSWGKVLPANLDITADNTTANATSGHHGLLPKLSGSASDALRGDGAFGKVTGAGLTKLAGQTVQITQTTIAHGLSGTPTVVIVMPLGVSFVYESQAADGTNIYLTAAGVTTCDVYVAL